MTLRRRLILGLIAVSVVLAIAGTTLALLQRNSILGQLDAQLESARPLAQKLVNQLSQRAPEGDLTVVKGETYLGHLLPSGELITLVEPVSDPSLRPDVTDVAALDVPRTRPTTTGSTRRVRVLAAPLKDGSTAIIAVSTQSANAAFRRLAIAGGLAALVVLAVMGLVVVWVIRLGLRPIRRMTDAADSITAGAIHSRIEVADDGTEAARLGAALNTMIDTNRTTEARLRRFVADASHELRTPLTTLRGYSALYESGGLPTGPEIDDAMRRIGQESARMSRIVDDLLLLARLDERREQAVEPVALDAVLRDVVSDARIIQPERPITATCEPALVVMGDRDHLLQAVTALVSNALRHTDPDAPIAITGVQRGADARIAVDDRGPGIDPDSIDHVFERFYRADTGRARTSGGTGLGLSIVAAIVESHGGRCGVDSAPGIGSTFWIEIPLISG